MDSTLTLANALDNAGPGAVLQAQLFPVEGSGNLRVTYNWLYSALNCDPNDTSMFTWVFTKLSGNAVALSPAAQYSGMTLYASVRPDISYYVEVQAPYSADWITAIGGDETLTMNDLGLLTVNFQGVNGQYLAVNPNTTTHDDSSGNSHTGYLLQSNAPSPGPATNMFVAVTQLLQDGIEVPLATSLSVSDIGTALAEQGVKNATAIATSIHAAIQ